jgi:hypothetical protein
MKRSLFMADILNCNQQRVILFWFNRKQISFSS